MKNKILNLFALTLALGLQNAEAAKLKRIDSLESSRLENVLKSWNEMCDAFYAQAEGDALTCSHQGVAILSRSRSEKWENTVKQSIYFVDSYVSEADAAIVKNTATQLAKEIELIMDSASYERNDPRTNKSITLMKQTLKNEIAGNASILVMSAGFEHAFGNGMGICLVDLESGEILQLFMNYGE